jgi:3-deoxy-D-manno-octulosonate 8-phosphate phosphatase (KDO 8-P phosphatase)
MHNHDLPDFRAIGKHFKAKLSPIKVLAFDVDGILTNGNVYWDGEECGFNRHFNVLDGYGMRALQRLGYKIGIITGGNSIGVLKRFEENLKLDFVYMGNEDKRESFKKLMAEGHDASEILYMGDEFFDTPLMKKAGFSATVAHASHEVREVADYVCYRDGGCGCVREVIDIFRYANDIEIPIPQFD